MEMKTEKRKPAGGIRVIKVLSAVLMSLCIFILATWSASAHQPRLVSGDQVIVDDAEVSKAYYDMLTGTPRIYIIDSQKPFSLYLNLLVPKSSNPDGRYSANVYEINAGKKVELARLNAGDVQWTEFYEEYGGDYYLKGPECKKTLPGGRYEIEVYSADNLGKYVIAIGEKEEFPPIEIVKTFLILPVLKVQFFQYPTAILLSSTIGIAWLIIIAILLLVIGLVLHKFFSVNSRRSNRPPL
jgi:hypothetical protein